MAQLLKTTVDTICSCFLTTWAISKSALVTAHDRQNQNYQNRGATTHSDVQQEFDNCKKFFKMGQCQKKMPFSDILITSSNGLPFFSETSKASLQAR